MLLALFFCLSSIYNVLWLCVRVAKKKEVFCDGEQNQSGVCGIITVTSV